MKKTKKEIKPGSKKDKVMEKKYKVKPGSKKDRIMEATGRAPMATPMPMMQPGAMTPAIQAKLNKATKYGKRIGM